MGGIGPGRPHGGGVGTALPSQRTFLRLALKQKNFRLDQAKISDNVVRKSDMGESKCKSFFFVMSR